MYIFYLKYIVELLRAPLYNFFFCIIFSPGISKKKYARRRLPKIKITVPLVFFEEVPKKGEKCSECVCYFVDLFLASKRFPLH